MNNLVGQFDLDSGKSIQILFGDISEENADGVVNAANTYLQHGGGVAGAISLRGGSIIQEESDQWIKAHGLVPHESPAYTSGGELPCRYVIHAVGPVWGEGDEDKKLAKAISGSLALADQLSLTSIALPAISTGVFQFPLRRAAEIILSEIKIYLCQNPASKLLQVRLVLFEQSSLAIFLELAKLIFENPKNKSDTDESTNLK